MDRNRSEDLYAGVPDEAWAPLVLDDSPFWEDYQAGRLTARETHDKQNEDYLRHWQQSIDYVRRLIALVEEQVRLYTEGYDARGDYLPEGIFSLDDVVEPIQKAVKKAYKLVEKDLAEYPGINARTRSMEEGIAIERWRKAHEQQH